MVKIIKQSYEIITDLDGLVILKNIEKSARTCYKSENLIIEDGESARKLVKKLVERDHTAMLEHGGMISVRIICNRGLTHELVRHRAAISFAQESTRYCDYIKGKFGNQITVILPLDFYGLYPILTEKKMGHIENLFLCNFYKEFNFTINDFYKYKQWKEAMENAEQSYFKLRKLGLVPQIARGVLPIDIKTEIIVSTNPTEWRHIFKLRTSEAAHPQIRTLMRGLLEDFKEKIPIIFDDINPRTGKIVKCGFVKC